MQVTEAWIIRRIFTPDERKTKSMLTHVNHVLNNMTNPFDPESHPHALNNISTGLHETQEVQKSFLSIAEVGENCMKRFCDTDLNFWRHSEFPQNDHKIRDQDIC